MAPKMGPAMMTKGMQDLASLEAVMATREPKGRAQGAEFLNLGVQVRVSKVHNG